MRGSLKTVEQSKMVHSDRLHAEIEITFNGKGIICIAGIQRLFNKSGRKCEKKSSCSGELYIAHT